MNTIVTTYTDSHLRILIEEFIAMQRSEFTFKGVCQMVLSGAFLFNRSFRTIIL